MVNLLPRQQAAKEKVFEYLANGFDKQFLSFPTGTGKTVLACDIAKSFKKTLFLVHRKELLDQTINTMKRVSPKCKVGSIAQGKVDIKDFTVGMIQTVYNRLTKIDENLFDLVIIDEAHHAMAKIWRTVADYFTPKLRLGLSATPERMDGADLSNLFSYLSYQFTILEAVEEGYLTKPLSYQVDTKVDLNKVGVAYGDFKDDQLEKTINADGRNQTILDVYQKVAANRNKTIVFTAGVEHAQTLASLFRAANIRADWVAGNDKNRVSKIENFRSGVISVMFNAMLLTEGFDLPTIDCVFLTRPTISKVLFTQMVGRGLRLSPTKKDCLLIDFKDNFERHKLEDAWSLFGHEGEMPDDEIIDLTDFSRDNRQQAFINFFMENAPNASLAKAEQWALRMVDLLKPPPDSVLQTCFQYGEKSWHYDPITEKQRWRLKLLGHDPDNTDFTKGQAFDIISQSDLLKHEKQLLIANGYDVLNYKWDRRMYNNLVNDKTKSLA